MLLIRPLASAGFEDKIGSSFLAEWVVAKERKDGGPLRHDRLPFVAFPTFVNLAKSAKLARHIFLTLIQDKPSVAKVFAERYRTGDNSFLLENECPKSLPLNFDFEKAKWQNSVIRILNPNHAVSDPPLVLA